MKKENYPLKREDGLHSNVDGVSNHFQNGELKNLSIKDEASPNLMKEVEEFKNLLSVCDHLLGPNGCPWDREQTMMSCRAYALEEVCELIDAIDTGENQHIVEELGDFFYNAVFLSRLAEKEGRCNLKEVIHSLTQKLIRRHPHVFEDSEAETSADVLHHWERIKGQEMGSYRKSALDGIPKSLPSLSRAHKVLKKMKKGNAKKVPLPEEPFSFHDEDSLGTFLLTISAQALEMGLDPEHALRLVLAKHELAFRESEKQ